MHKSRQSSSEWALAHAQQVANWPKNRIERSEAFALTLDFIELRDQAGKVMGSECVSLQKVEEGGVNQLYLLTFENNAEAIARISLPGKFPFDRVVSEVATLQYLRGHTSVPVPNVFFSSADSQNRVGAPFTLQERIQGQTLQAVWWTMSNEQQENLLTNLASFEAKLWSTQFEGVGSLARDSAGAFKVGPLVPMNSDWNTDDPERGPWTSCQSYISALAERELRWLEEKPHEFFYKHQAQWGSDQYINIDQLKSLYRLLQKLATRLPFFKPSTSHSGILHVDLTTDNVLVDLIDICRVVAIVDWDFARVVPLWACFREYDFIRDYADAEPAARTRSAALRKLRQDIITEGVPNASVAIHEGAHFRMLERLVSIPSWCFKTIGEAKPLVEKLRDVWPADDPGYNWIVDNLNLSEGYGHQI